jgi:hypothetical protein
LAGTQTYGDSTDDSNPWSVNFETAVPGWDEFLFASGDCTRWLAAIKEAVLGGPPTPAPYDFAQRSVLKSSTSSSPYTAEWIFRSGKLEDPLISLGDYTPVDNTNADTGKNCDILHIENSWGISVAEGIFRQCTVRDYGGADVYVRLSGD